MKSLRCFLAMVVLGVSSLGARADLSDFKLEILDPSSGGPYLYYVNGTGSIPFTFGLCPSNNPYASNADGCFTAYNNTDQTFTSLGLSFDNYSSTAAPTDFFNFLNSQPANCDTSPATTAFTRASACGLSADSSRYNLLFTGGAGFVPGEYIVIAEFGASEDAFRNGSLTVFPMIASTPEPETLWLLTTGAVLPAAAWWKRRKAAASDCV